MLKRKPNLFIPFLLCFLLIACSTGKYTLNVLIPGKYVLPKDIQRITVYLVPCINEAPGHYDSIIDVTQSTIGYNANLKYGYTEGVFQEISGSPRFKAVNISDRRYDTLMHFGNLTWVGIDSICRHDRSDALLVLTHAVSYIGREMDVILNHSTWGLYQPFSHRMLLDMPYTDTVSVSPGLINEYDIPYMLYQNSYTMGSSFGRLLAPYWKETDRQYYIGPGKQLRKAGRLVPQDKWYYAGIIWNELSLSGNAKIASRAAFNIALAYEKDDDLDQALSWISYADSLKSSTLSREYKQSILRRISIRPQLDAQMEGN